jgi:hypothetical protein
LDLPMTAVEVTRRILPLGRNLQALYVVRFQVTLVELLTSPVEPRGAVKGRPGQAHQKLRDFSRLWQRTLLSQFSLQALHARPRTGEFPQLEFLVESDAKLLLTHGKLLPIKANWLDHATEQYRQSRCPSVAAYNYAVSQQGAIAPWYKRKKCT